MNSSDLVALAIAERMISAVNDGNLDLLDEILSADINYHGEPSHMAAEPWTYKNFIGALREAFPDLSITPDHVDATATDIAVIYTISGTHEGKFLGLEPTGKRVSARGMQIVRLEAGKVVERWGSSDDIVFFRLLSALQ